MTILNLIYDDTIDKRIYERLYERLQIGRCALGELLQQLLEAISSGSRPQAPSEGSM